MTEKLRGETPETEAVQRAEITLADLEKAKFNPKAIGIEVLKKFGFSVQITEYSRQGLTSTIVLDNERKLVNEEKTRI